MSRSRKSPGVRLPKKKTNVQPINGWRAEKQREGDTSRSLGGGKAQVKHPLETKFKKKKGTTSKGMSKHMILKQGQDTELSPHTKKRCQNTTRSRRAEQSFALVETNESTT